MNKSDRNCFVTIVAIYLLAKQARQNETFSGFYQSWRWKTFATGYF
jgi:hypothetical protein